jgi:archaeal cell division control protein 6
MFDRASAVIKDSTKLSFEYVPEILVHREEQMKQLEMLFRPMVMEGCGCSAFLSGGVGTGKTATAKRFCEDMSKYCARTGKLMDYVFVNCRIRNTEYGVLLHLVRHFDSGFPERGFSAEEMLRSFRTHIENSARPIIVVFDEVDMLLKNNSKNLVYQMMRMNDELKRSSVSLMMISQVSIVELLDEASLSTFKRANTIRFERYSVAELKEIIDIRAKEALVTNALGTEEVSLLAEIASQYGDARFAIELIERSASIAESEKIGRITADDIRTANAMIYSDVSENKLRDLDINRKLALLAISRAIKSESYVSITSAEKTYAVVCEEYEQVARKHTQFWTYIQDMEHSGLLSTEVKSEIEGGRVTYISIPNIPPKELAKKLEYLMELPQSTDEYEW